MLGTDRDGGSLEREVFSVEVDECICYLCDCDQDYLCEDDLDNASREAASHPPGEADGSRNPLMLDDVDLTEPHVDYTPEDVAEHFKTLTPLMVDDDGWPVEQPPGLSATIC